MSGKPIVMLLLLQACAVNETPDEAVETFLAAGLHALAIGNYLALHPKAFG